VSAGERFLDHAEKGPDGERFRQQRKTFQGDEALHEIGIVEAGDEQDLQVGLLGAEALREDGAGQVRHDDIRQEEMDRLRTILVDFDSIPAAVSGEDAVTGGR